MSDRDHDKRRATRAVRAGIDDDAAHGAVTPPIVLSSTFTFEGYDRKRGYDYGRSGNPTRSQLADAIASLEGAAGGVVTASGMGAITVVLTALLGPGDRIVVPHDCYGGSWRLFNALGDKGAFVVDRVDLADAAALAGAIARQPAMVWIETPSNPLLRITDIAQVASAAKAAGAVVVADNTFLSPLLQRPLELGCDIVVHSTTKYLNGHSDVIGGAVVARDAGTVETLGWWANCLGLTGAPFDSWLTLRGLRTLPVRMRAHQDNAAAIADLLGRHPAVAAVHYPGLASHPGHALAAAQQDGFGAMLSFDLHGGEAAVKAAVEGLGLWTLAESLGGVESLVAHPATMTHAAMSPEALALAGIGPGLLRLSVGIEQVDDLAADLTAALDRALAATRNPA